MTDDQDDIKDELGKTGEKVGGIAERFDETSEMTETSETTETTDTTKEDLAASSDMTETSETTNTTETPEADDEGFVLREDWNGRTIYLPDNIVDALDIRYSEVNVEWQREHGEQLPKNERFYPAMVRAAINETSIEKELDLDE